MRLRFRTRRGPCALATLFLISLAVVVPASAQSGDASFPTPIFSNVVTGRIAPRDLGDPRRTRHFYTFRATEGDLVVRLESTNLNGDVDLFTARTLRPLLKITLFGGSATNATKSVYLRAEETLILRVEARAAGEDEGSYRITIGNTFVPAPAELATAPEPALPSAAERSGRGTRRVTSTGARIEEPTPEPTAEAAASQPTPEAPAARATESAERPTGDAQPRAGEETTARPAPRRNTRRGRAANRTRNRAETQPRPPAANSDDAERPAEASEARPTEREAASPEAARTAPRARGRAAARGRRRGASEDRNATTGERTGEASAAAAAAAPPQRLVIVKRDGETVEHDMSTVRRVTVENNQVVVTTKDGRTIRRPLTDVLRMSIEPLPQP
jgi:hypothetical protein